MPRISEGCPRQLFRIETIVNFLGCVHTLGECIREALRCEVVAKTDLVLQVPVMSRFYHVAYKDLDWILLLLEMIPC